MRVSGSSAIIRAIYYGIIVCGEIRVKAVERNIENLVTLI